MELAQHLQQRLQSIYELELDHCISDFLITGLASRDGGQPNSAPAEESLLICQDGDDLFLSLYLQAEILENLKFNGPGLHIHKGNINDFCLALEGTSHFVYLIWNATYQRCITMLEMEIQAEIDKFIILSKYTCRQQLRPVSRQLLNLLFETVRYRDGMTGIEYRRYRDANYWAGRYCRFLETRDYLRDGLEPELLRELRRFYRLNLRDKLRRISYLH
jgi:hypothetical protein